MCEMPWVNHGQQLSTHQLLTHYPSPAGWGRELEEQKREKLVGQDKDSLISEGKREKKKTPPTSDAEAVTHPLLPADRRPASLWGTATLERLP